MRRSLCFAILFVVAAHLYAAGPERQQPAATAEKQRPQFRPAVLPFGADSLVNRIDAQALMTAGQKDGAVMFCAVVAPNGDVKQSRTYRGMPGTAALEEEVRKRMQGAKFTPAIYNHQPVGVVASGTVFFSITNDKPHIRLFLNQDGKELKEENDFVAPQPVFGADSPFTGYDYPTDVAVQVNAVVDMRVIVDASGNPRAMRVIGEEPPLLGFAMVAAKDFNGAKFIPAFRAGEAVECDVDFPVCYQPADWATPSFAPPREALGNLADPLNPP